MPDVDDHGQITAEDIVGAPNSVPVTDTDTPVSRADIFKRFVEVSDENSDLKLENEKLRAARKTADILDGLIGPYATKTFRFMCIYCGVVGALLAFHGFNFCDFNLSDGVLQILVGSTATTVIGLVGMVLTGIFVGARKPSSPD